VRVEADHPGRRVQSLRDGADVVGGDAQTAHRLLRDDQVGLELGQQFVVELVDRLAALGALADGGVDLLGREAVRDPVACP
jgi:hypothetical protein